jgi:hypothetical protein
MQPRIQRKSVALRTSKSFARYTRVLLLWVSACASAPSPPPAREPVKAAPSSLLAAPNAAAALAPPNDIETHPPLTPSGLSRAVASSGAGGSISSEPLPNTENEAAGAAPEPSRQAPLPADPVASNTSKERKAFQRPVFWYCYVWAHLRFITKDCFDTIKECRQMLPKTEGVALQPCMAQKKPTWCTESDSVPEDDQDPKSSSEERDERCFGTEDACQVYRAHLRGSGLESTPCVEVKTK